ncbi:MAG: hypothetical protein RSB24_09220, partial [Akkermansia sp.]
VTLNSSITGAGNIRKTGTGNITLSGANTAYAGAIDLSAGTLTWGNVNALGTGVLTISGSSTLNLGGFAVANNLNISAGITSTLSNAGAYAGTVTLNGSNGTTNLSTLALGTQAVNVAIADGKFGAITGWDTGVTGKTISLGAGATYQGNLALGAGQHLSLAKRDGAPTNSTVTGNLTLTGSTLDFLMDRTTDTAKWNALTVNGVLTLNGAISANINSIGTKDLTPNETYTLITANSIAGTYSFTVNENTAINGRNTSIEIGSTTVSLKGHTADTLAWTGESGTWTQEAGFAKIGASIGTTGSPWTVVGTLGTDNRFYSNDIVEFKGTTGGTVTIAGNITPKAITVSQGDYTFAGGAIGGASTLAITGGSLTLNNANTFTGLTTLTG